MKRQPLALRVGRAIRERREASEYSQESFADSIGMHRAYYSAIERGEKNVTLPTLLRITVGLGVTFSELLEGVDQ